MNMETKPSLFLLLLIFAAGCSGPTVRELEPIAPASTSGTIQPETSAPSPQPAASTGLPKPSSSETTVSSPPTEFDPEGLSIGPGSSFVVLDDPAVIPGTQATWLDPEELILGVSVGGEARAYPISQMAYHHIANDQIDGEPYLVTY
ncbi:MAG: DUF3179 domain-containing protein [Nitrospirae bacterium]|nr:DUF3179 domain-containing protein [Nitrospirota bacterium]